MVVQLALTVTFFLFCLGVIYGAICDVRTFVIPNRVPYGLAGLFAVFAALVWLATPAMPHMGFYLPPILQNVTCGFAVFAFFFVFWRLGWVGGGDVKFVAAISLWTGPEYVGVFVILLAVISVLYVMLLKTLQMWNPYYQAGNWPTFVKKMLLKMEESAIPYGLPTAIAALIVMPGIMANAYSLASR